MNRLLSTLNICNNTSTLLDNRYGQGHGYNNNFNGKHNGQGFTDGKGYGYANGNYYGYGYGCCYGSKFDQGCGYGSKYSTTSNNCYCNSDSNKFKMLRTEK